MEGFFCNCLFGEVVWKEPGDKCGSAVVNVVSQIEKSGSVFWSYAIGLCLSLLMVLLPKRVVPFKKVHSC